MLIDDIHKEKDILLYLGSRLDNFKKYINSVFSTNNIECWGTEYDIPKYDTYRRIYGGARVDLMFGNDEMLVPIELKYDGNANGYQQIKRYVNLLQERTNKKVNGVLMCVNATRSLEETNVDENILIIELSTGKAW
jgi:hypothetical protein